jgi:hypothetical protein
METIIVGIIFCVIMTVAAVCCIPPFLQAKEYNDKVTMFISIFCFVLMIGLIIGMISKMVGMN